MTPAEQARAEVEAWFAEYGHVPVVEWLSADALIFRLTPVFERAQAADIQHLAAFELFKAIRVAAAPDADPMDVGHLPGVVDTLRERAERAEARVAELEKLCNDLAANELGYAHEAADEHEARKAAEAKQHATRDELNQRDGTIIDLRAALEIAEAEAEMWKCHTCGKAEADVACLRTALQVATDYNGVAGKERDGMAQRLLALESDVARLREAFELLQDHHCGGMCQVDHDAVMRIVNAALAATEPKR